MLSSSNVVAVAAVAEIARAKEFYEGTLGLQPLEIEEPGGVLYECAGGSRLLVYESRYAGTNQATAASWQVEDVDQEVSELAGRGVSFEHYELPGTTLEGDVHVMGELRAAWFKDPDGNILNIVSREGG
jgi:catechol 2,3-dioxygenase-like lactoylglutathione lyase family enzyme